MRTVKKTAPSDLNILTKLQRVWSTAVVTSKYICSASSKKCLTHHPNYRATQELEDLILYIITICNALQCQNDLDALEHSKFCHASHHGVRSCLGHHAVDEGYWISVGWIQRAAMSYNFQKIHTLLGCSKMMIYHETIRSCGNPNVNIFIMWHLVGSTRTLPESYQNWYRKATR